MNVVLFQVSNESELTRVDYISEIIVAELRRAKRASGAPWVRNFGNLSLREILVMTSAYARPRLQTLGEGEWSPKAARPGVGGGE